MKLSIIIPTYNVEDYIEECLRSVLPQLTDDCELIIVDDHSIDNTVPKIIELINYGFENENRYKFYINTENKGVAATRNVGLKVATGDYIAFLDGDDLFDKEYIQVALNNIKSNKECYKLSWERFNLEPVVFFAKHLPSWNCSCWCRIYRRDIIKEYFNETLRTCEDKQFLIDNGMLRAIDDYVEDTNIYKYGYIDEPIYKYRGGRLGSLCNPKPE